MDILIKLRNFQYLTVDTVPTAPILSHDSKDDCTLIVALSNNLQLYLNHIKLNFPQGSCLILTSEELCECAALEEGEIALFTFSTFTIMDGCVCAIQYPYLNFGQVYQLTYSTIARRLNNQPRQFSKQTVSQQLIQQGDLQVILGMMLQKDEDLQLHKQHENKIKRIKHTMTYMEQHYDEDITVEQLANMAGMVRWQYSKMFHVLTGQKPTQYLTKIRIQCAKKILQHSRAPLSKVAQQVGFKDEYYFSRCFRKQVGYAPRKYANAFINHATPTIIDSLGREIPLPSHKERIVTDGKYTLGEMLVLGISPIGAAITMENKVIYYNRLRHIENLGHWADPKKMALLEPEIVLLSYHHYKQDLKELDQLAPTIIVDNTMKLFERLRYIATVFQRHHVAEKWIETYTNKATIVRQQLTSYYQKGRTATVYLKLDERIYIMGQNGLGASIYESLGFQPIPSVMAFIKQKKPWIEIQKHQIKDYQSEHNFILIPDKEWSKTNHYTMFYELIHQQVYFLNAKWNYEDPITRNQLLDVFPNILSSFKLEG